jgi:predicted AAA+ superfamily ATPase
MKRFPAKFVAQRIDFENIWWNSGLVGNLYTDKPKRSFFPLFFKKLSFQQGKSVVLFGAKRVGKTTFIFQAIQELLNTGFRKRNIVYISLENPLYYKYTLNEIIEILFYQRHNTKKEPYIFFFDQIQYYAASASELVKLVNDYPNIKFVFSGSMGNSSINTLKEADELFEFFRLPTLTFFEYVNFIHKESFIECDEGVDNCNLHLLNNYFLEYLQFGGHPELLFENKLQTEKVKLLINRILNKFTLKAFPGLAGINELDEINAFVAYLILNTGKITNLKIITSETELSDKTVSEFIDFLKNIFFIKVLKPFRMPNSDDFKIYIANPSFITAVFDFENVIKYLDFNLLVETAILAQWENTLKDFWYYHSPDFSISFISSDNTEMAEWCSVVNYSGNNIKNYDKFTAFCEQECIYFPIITSKNLLGHQELNGLILSNQPSCLYCYQVGRHIIESQLIDD